MKRALQKTMRRLSRSSSFNVNQINAVNSNGSSSGGETLVSTPSSTRAHRPEAQRIILMGSGAVGKSSITTRFILGTYDGSDYDPTIEDIYQVTVDDGTGQKKRVEVVDTGGQEDFSLYSEHFRAGNGFIFVYDITSAPSLEELETRYFPGLKQLMRGRPVVIVGNKCDLEERRKVSVRDGQRLASRHHCCGFFEVSAKTGENIKESFLEILTYLKNHPPGRSISAISGDNQSVPSLDRSRSSNSVFTQLKPNDASQPDRQKGCSCILM